MEVQTPIMIRSLCESESAGEGGEEGVGVEDSDAAAVDLRRRSAGNMPEMKNQRTSAVTNAATKAMVSSMGSETWRGIDIAASEGVDECAAAQYIA